MTIILALAGFLRFYNLMFDTPYFFNPDERNMAAAITQFRIPENLNPRFFAYGQFPLYLAFFTDQASQLLTTHYHLPTSFYSAVFWLRFYSALSSTLTVLLVFLVAKKLFTPPAGGLFALLAAAFVALTPGLLQAAHFGTTESLLTFFFLSSVYCALKYLRKSIPKYIFLGSVLAGLALGTKLTGIFCIVPLLCALCIACIKHKKNISHILILIIVTASIGILSSPYSLIDLNDFKSAVFGYESDIATGKYKAFYTVQFEDSLPFLYQAEKVFPYALGWPLFILGSAGLFIMAIKVRKDISRTYYIVLLVSFLIYLIPNAVLYTKWTRFTTPIIPFFSLFATYFLYKLYCLKSKSFFVYFCIVAFSIIALLPGLSFMSIYTHEDTRFQATEWIYKNIPADAHILSETANVIDIPLSSYNLPARNATHSVAGGQPTTYNLNVISFDFYHLDENPELVNLLVNHLENSQYIFVPSRRLFANYLNFPKKYPILTAYYNVLFSGKLGFQKVAEFTSYPKLEIGNWKLEIPDEQSEETWTVFDHPVVRIYKKTKYLTKNEYASLFKN